MAQTCRVSDARQTGLLRPRVNHAKTSREVLRFRGPYPENASGNTTNILPRGKCNRPFLIRMLSSIYVLSQWAHKRSW